MKNVSVQGRIGTIKPRKDGVIAFGLALDAGARTNDKKERILLTYWLNSVSFDEKVSKAIKTLGTGSNVSLQGHLRPKEPYTGKNGKVYDQPEFIVEAVLATSLTP